MTDNTQEKVSRSVGRWRQPFVAAALVGGGVLHGTKPHWFALDWPADVLILVGALVWLIPVTDFGLVFESLELLGAKIHFRSKAQALHDDVERAKFAEEAKHGEDPETADVVIGRRWATDAVKRGSRNDMGVDSERGVESQTERPIDAQPRTLFGDVDTSQLLAGDKKMALINLGVQIETAMNVLLARLGMREQGQTYLHGLAILLLRQKGAITQEMANALFQFQNVRNEIVHSSRSVPDAVVTSAVDSGLTMLQILNSAIGYRKGA